jgi:hypothetical protein
LGAQGIGRAAPTGATGPMGATAAPRGERRLGGERRRPRSHVRRRSPAAAGEWDLAQTCASTAASAAALAARAIYLSEARCAPTPRGLNPLCLILIHFWGFLHCDCD